tara:strand:- start:306 stop:473 length:168 start_codon:yes stop_codon:yes gene_type:complete
MLWGNALEKGDVHYATFLMDGALLAKDLGDNAQASLQISLGCTEMSFRKPFDFYL